MATLWDRGLGLDVNRKFFAAVNRCFEPGFQIVTKSGKPIKIEFHPMRSSSSGVRFVKVVVKNYRAERKILFFREIPSFIAFPHQPSVSQPDSPKKTPSDTILRHGMFAQPPPTSNIHPFCHNGRYPNYSLIWLRKNP